ncbi:DNA-binding transcriptional activator of the SARP family [Geodermatophilus pulveris]|uniref:DNA-binding transcriptional activator of the SARP family n=1 Tax=Geodermatophilus pulveris TaxID=1564159 RepID=A0A239GHV0_9ACTN|nr:LysM peptidoglycan-binding domain-containing protein [Geodermatophilus pulveris]SNS68876.1 DNA-binding transcriptional activator of the SARP family [Geodermatophilus pulveris]
MTTTPRSLDLLRRLLALLALVAALAGVPTALWQLGAAYLPTALPSWEQVTAALSGPDTGAVFLGLLVVIGWAAWAVFALSVAVELAAQLRGLPPLRLPGLAAPQQLAGLLVAAVVGVGGAPLLAAPAIAGPPVVAEQPTDEPPPLPAPSPDAEPAEPAANGPTYTVQPRDTLGRIAARSLGDWARFEEILELNRGRTQPDGAVLADPALIRPGWVLVLPADATPPEAGATAVEVTVQPGDTLADIAEQQGLNGWQPIFDINAGEPLPGGGRFTDPDLIRPGQVLDLPPAELATPDPPPPAAPEPPAEDAPPSPPPPSEAEAPMPAEPSPTPPVSPPSASRSDEPAPPAADSRDAEADQFPSELAAVLAGSGALLAAGTGVAWLAHRRQRLRRRRTGRRLAPVPQELSATQTAVTSAADAGTADYAALDLALRSLAVRISDDPDGRLPDVVAARLHDGRLDLRLHTPADRPPPEPWTADDTGLWWSVQLDQDTGVAPEVARARLAPYPTLVTIGVNGADRWLLDLERLGAVYITGPADRRQDFARHLAAELAVNSWSDLLTITPVGFGDELVDLAPHRIHPVDTPADPELRSTLCEAVERDSDDLLDGRLRAGAGDGWMPHVVLTPHRARQDDGELAEAAAVLRGSEQRAALALVLGVEPAQASDEGLLTLTDDGSLLVPALGLRLPAPQLTAQQARDIATLLSFERDAMDDAIPASGGDRPWQVHTDAAGALLDDAKAEEPGDAPHRLPQPRPPRRASAGGAALGPVPPEDRPKGSDGNGVKSPGQSRPTELRQRIEDDLEQLDRDLADWWSSDCARPRLSLLGPVTLRAHGDEHAVARSGRRRRYEEVVAYLATRPHGATADEAATALQPARGGKTDPVSVRAYVHRMTAGARAWLGDDPATGEKHLSSGYRGRYTLTGVLVDADLFRQLRARAEVRGDDGLPDLLAALELVSGPPFAQRPAGYEWLDGLDLTLTAGICDVAHQVVTAALTGDDLAAARAASATALLVAPDDEKVLLDAMWVAYHEGSRAEAETYVARIVDIHDGEDEMDLPMSTAEAVNRARRQFLDRAS